MATTFGLPPPEPPNIQEGNTSLIWKKIKQKWTHYDIATGIPEKENTRRVATFLTVIGEKLLMFSNLKKNKVLEKFDAFSNPRKNTIYERFVFFSRNQENCKSIDHYVNVLKTLSETFDIGDFRESLIRDRVVFGILDNSVRERLLRDYPCKQQLKKPYTM